jgi:hypothetical protein
VRLLREPPPAAASRRATRPLRGLLRMTNSFNASKSLRHAECAHGARLEVRTASMQPFIHRLCQFSSSAAQSADPGAGVTKTTVTARFEAKDDVPIFPVAANRVPVIRRRLSRSIWPVFAGISFKSSWSWKRLRRRRRIFPVVFRFVRENRRRCRREFSISAFRGSVQNRHSGGQAERGRPEPMNTGLWEMGSGLAAERRPGMTIAIETLWATVMERTAGGMPDGSENQSAKSGEVWPAGGRADRRGRLQPALATQP